MHYRDILRQELAQRIAANSRYSLRAFARDLGLRAPQVSEILNGKRGLSESSAQQIAEKLGMSPNETVRFTALVKASDARSKRERQNALVEMQSVQNQYSPRELQEDAFRTIADWYHYAILELTALKDFPHATSLETIAAWVAARLGIHKIEAGLAMERLLRLELLEKVSLKGKFTLRATDAQITTSDGVYSASIRKFNRQILEKAIDAITAQTIAERELGTLTVAVHEEDLSEIKNILKTQRRALNAWITERNRKRKPNQVYCLAQQFFRLSQNSKKESL